MRFARSLLLAALVLAGVALVMIVTPRGRGRPPSFVPGAPAVAVPFWSVNFDSTADAPFAGGKLWLWAGSGTNVHQYLFDLEQRVIVGELFDAGQPQFCNQDASRLLVTSGGIQPGATKQRVVDAVNSTALRLFGEELWPRRDEQTVWVLNLTNNSAVYLGKVPHGHDVRDRWHPAPDFRRAYTSPTGSLFLCDLEGGSLKEIPIKGSPVGWWNDHQLLIDNGTNQFDLFDVGTRTSSSLFSPAVTAAFLESNGLSIDPHGLWAERSWNGHNYDFYFTRNLIRFQTTFLLRADCTSPTLRLLYRDFETQPFGCFDSMGTRYVYPGVFVELEKDGAIYLRQLTNNVIVPLVPPDSKKHYGWACFPRFYGNEIIYARGGLLWRMELTTSNETVLLPESGR